MTSMTAPPITVATSGPAHPAGLRRLDDVVSAASDAVAELSPDDPRWEAVGVLLTAVVDAVGVAAGLRASPIRPGEQVAPVVRLRDLGRLVQAGVPREAAKDGAAGRIIEELLWSLQVAAA